MTDVEKRAIFIVQILRKTRLRVSAERFMQEDVEEALKYHGVEHHREFSLNAADRPDFLTKTDGILVECKVKYPKRAIYRQLERYARHERVQAIILVSCTAMGLPAEINGKPTYFVSGGLSAL